MKKLFFIYAASMLMCACGGSKNEPIFNTTDSVVVDTVIKDTVNVDSMLKTVVPSDSLDTIVENLITA